MGYDGQGIGKRIKGIFSPNVATLWVKQEGLDFDGKRGMTVTMENTFLKAKDMAEWACLLKEREVSEGGSLLLPHLSCGGLKKGSNEKMLNT